MGSESKKTRPALIVSNDIGNEISDRVVVAPITGQIKKVYPFEVSIQSDTIQGKAMLDQIRCIDKKRLQNKISQVSEEKLREINTALKLVLALD